MEPDAIVRAINAEIDILQQVRALLTGHTAPKRRKVIGELCAKQFRTFQDLAEKLNMDVTELMRQCSGKASPSKALVKALAKELGIDESFLEKLAGEVRKDLG